MPVRECTDCIDGARALKRLFAVALAAGLLAGCWNGENIHLRMGDVSMGRQLIDLKAALEQGAITPAEHDRLKMAMMSLDVVCQASDDDE